jgi:hypothetical protein
MTNEQYIAALTKALGGLGKESRSDIIQEIQSHEAESGSSLLERFGRPETLAEQYLEGEVIKTPVTKKVLGAGKKMFLWLGILASTMVAALVFFIWTASSDDFNYADESSSELDKASASWVTKPWAEGMSIEVEQSSAVFYWHDEPTVRWQCNGSEPPVIKDSKLTFRQSKCLIMVPKMELKLITDQAQIVLVRPQASLELNIRQTGLRIAENETQYRYEVNANRSNFTDLSSYEEAEHIIKIESLEATISPYEER